MKKLISIFILSGVLLTSSPAYALTLSDLKKEVEILKTEILNLKSRLSGNVLGVSTTTYSFGMTNSAIIPLQQALVNQGYLASGNATGNFFSLTLQAVQNFQKANGLTVTGTLNSQTQNLLLSSSNVSVGGNSCDAVNDFWKYDNSSNTWTQQANFGGGVRESAVGFTIGYKGYLGTGKDEFGIKKDFWEWDGDTGVWTQKADFGGGDRQQAVAFSIGNLGYLGTGYNINAYSGGTSDFWEYNPSTNTWTKKADFGGGLRARAIGFSINGKGYIGTGDQSGTLMKDFWEWDQATNTWTKKADFGGVARIEAVSFPIGNIGYVGTGSDYENPSNNNQAPNLIYKDFWSYNQITNTWTQKADYGGGQVARAVGFSALGDGFGYVGTGLGIAGLKQDFWEYSPTTNTWTQKQDYSGGKIDNAVGFSIRNYGYIGTGTKCGICTPDSWTQKADFGGSARWFASGFAIGNKGYIGTSGTFANPKDFWEWDQAINTWSQKANYPGNALHSSGSFSIGNLGYIGTGAGAGYSKDFWSYNPTTNNWNKKADFGGLARKDVASFSIGDKGYMGTGQVNDAQSFKDFWEYDSTTNTWTQKADFGGTARFEAASFSVGKKGYIGTGRDLNNNAYKDFWEWDQATNTWTKKADFGGVARHAATGISIGNYGYLGIGGSYFQGNVSYNDFWKYDPLTNTWTKKADYPGVAGYQAVGYSIGGFGYIGTGYNFSVGPAKDYWEYCPD